MKSDSITQKTILGKKIIFNGSIVDVFELPDLNNSLVIYEVIRVIDCVCLFLSDHLERLNNSARIAEVKIPVTPEQLIIDLSKLIKGNHTSEGNIKLTVQYLENQTNYYAYFIPHYYPTTDQYKHGVRLLSLKADRQNPNAKIWHNNLKNQVESMLEDRNIFEILLIDIDGYITEGSKSNVFFIKDDKIITAPYQRILPGITRKYILQACLRTQTDIEEKCLHYRELKFTQGCFISGTSPKVLPVNQIDQILIPPVHNILTKLMNEYNTIMLEFLANNK